MKPAAPWKEPFLKEIQTVFEWEAVFGDTALSVTFTVPEPAEISALLGALVLAIAIIRRRK